MVFTLQLEITDFLDAVKDKIQLFALHKKPSALTATFPGNKKIKFASPRKCYL